MNRRDRAMIAQGLDLAWSQLGNSSSDLDLPDPIAFADIEANWSRYRVSLIGDITSGRYKPSHVEVVDLPKDRLMVRPLSRLRLGARLSYEAAVLGSGQVIDNAVPREVYSYRWWKRKQRILGPIQSWLRMQRAARKHHRRNPDLLLARTDVTAFYESIDVEILLSDLSSLPIEDWALEVISGSLRAFNELGNVWGLPQGYDVSGMLANVYLLPIDSLLLSHGVKHFRYSDDTYVFGEDWLALRQLMLQLNSTLRNRRLTLSSSKTHIIDCHSVLDEFEEAEKDAINYGISIGSSASQLELRAYFDRVTSEEPVNPRDLKYCLGQLGRVRDEHAVKWLLANMGQLPHIARESLYYLSKFHHKIPEIGHEVVELLQNSILALYPYAEQHLLIYLLRQHFHTRKARQAAWELLVNKNKETFVREFAARYLGFHGAPMYGAHLKQVFQQEENTRVRRALLIACYESGNCTPALLRSVRLADPDLEFTATYLLKAPKKIPMPQVKWEP